MDIDNHTPELAVILPCFNPGRELEWTLGSLRAQTVPFRLFVTDDGSATKPDYRALLAGFDFELIELEHNVGPCLVRNTAMARALDQGFTFIAQMDCGDWAMPDRLVRQVAYLSNHPEIEALGSGAEIYSADGRYLYDFKPQTEPAEISRALFYGTAFNHPTLMYRADLMRRIGLYTGDFYAAEDYEYLRRADRIAPLANVPEPLIRKVERDDSVSNSNRFVQLVSRLRIQWRYRRASSVHTWLGICKTLVTLAVPRRAMDRLKPLIYGTPDPQSDEAHAPLGDIPILSEPQVVGDVENSRG